MREVDTDDQDQLALDAFFALMALGMGVLCFAYADPKTGITPEADLLIAQGKLAWLQKYRYGIHFGLEGNAQRFTYPSKAKRVDDVLER